MWFAKNNLCKIYKEDSNLNRVYIPLVSQSNKQAINDESIRSAYFVKGARNNKSKSSQSKNNHKLQSLSEQNNSKMPQSLTQLKDKNISNRSKNIEDVNETNLQTSQNINSINFLKELKNNTSLQQINISQDYQTSDQKVPFSFGEVNRRKTNHGVLTSNSVSQSLLSLSSQRTPYKQKNNALTSKNDKIEQWYKDENSQNRENLLKQQPGYKQEIGASQINLKTEDQTLTQRQIISSIFNKNRKSLDSLNFSKYMHLVETRRDKSIKNIIEQEQIMKENSSISQLNKLPQITNLNVSLEILQQLLTPRSRPSIKSRNHNNLEMDEKEQSSNNCLNNQIKNYQNINQKQCSSVSTHNFTCYNKQKQLLNEKVGFIRENQIIQKKKSEELIKELEQRQSSFNSPLKKNTENNNLQNSERKNSRQQIKSFLKEIK